MKGKNERKIKFLSLEKKKNKSEKRKKNNSCG